jgi:hypothetical protein
MPGLAAPIGADGFVVPADAFWVTKMIRAAITERAAMRAKGSRAILPYLLTGCRAW